MIGPRGERLAARWMRRRGYRILDRNLRIGSDEADLVALDPDDRTIVVVEVKTRRDAESDPTTRIDARKRRSLKRLADGLRHRSPYREKPIRIDVIAVVWPKWRRAKVRHYPAAVET